MIDGGASSAGDWPVFLFYVCRAKMMGCAVAVAVAVAVVEEEQEEQLSRVVQDWQLCVWDELLGCAGLS